MPIFGKDGCLPKGGMENMFSNGLTDGAKQILGLWELWLSQNTPMMDSVGSSFLRQLRFRITSLSWFSSSEKTAASKLMINGDCKSLPNLWSQNIPFEAYKWSISDLNVIYGFIRDLCGYHDVISDFLMDLLQHTPVDSSPQTSTQKIWSQIKSQAFHGDPSDDHLSQFFPWPC